MVFPDFKSLLTIPNLTFMHELVYIHRKKYRYEHSFSPHKQPNKDEEGDVVANNKESQLMSAIDVLNSEIRELQSENDPHKKHLTKLLLKQSNEQLNEVQKRELDDEIKSADIRISEINQIIIEKEK